jgi:hypothetical protein
MTYIDLIAAKLGVEPSRIKVRIAPTYASGYQTAHKSQQGRFNVTLDNNIVSVFDLHPLPGCCGVVVSTGSYINTEYRGVGLGSLLNKMRLDIAQKWGYGMILCTDVKHNERQMRVLRRNRWRKAIEFHNPRTNNNINLHTHTLNQTATELGFHIPL